MKHTNFAKRALAYGLAVALVVTSGNMTSTNVSAAKKSKAKLNKTKVSVIAGATTTLKVKKAKKKVKWSTSNKKIAKVTKTSGKKKETAVIKGLKKGKAVITAKVGGKKLKCTVKVQANKIKSASVDKLDHSAVIVKFTKKTSLNAGDVKVAVKEYQSGSYNTNPKVEALSTKDQKAYRLYLTSEVAVNSYVKLTVGKYSKEIQNRQKFMTTEEDGKVIIPLEKDVIVNLKDALDNEFMQEVGKISYSLKKGNKLPKGLSLVGKRGVLKGIPTTAGETTATLIAKDEAGRKANLTVTFKVYDDVTLAAVNYNKTIKLDDYMTDLNASRLATASPASGQSVTAAPSPSAGSVVKIDADDYYTTLAVEPLGGSGSYKYDLVQTGADAVKLSTDLTDTNNQVTKQAAASTTVYIPYGLAAGTHTYTINITDAADASRVTTATVDVEVEENFNVSGTVSDSLGNALSGNEALYFYPADAETSADYVYGRTYLKYQTKEDSYGDTDEVLIGGNHQSDYGGDGSAKVYGGTSDVYYYYYTHGETSQVGPFPIPDVLKEAPSASPSADAQATATPSPTASPESTAYKVADLAAGNYQAEVPAGTYTVKVLGNNGVKYQVNDTVTISADAVGTTNITMPVRFANVTGTAKFANGTAVAGSTVYFQSENKQYESWSFSAETDYQGSFTVSLPAGSYKMFWKDENQKRQYFTNTITIADDTNVAIGDQLLSINRCNVSGTFKLRTGTAETFTDTPESTTLYFYNSLGKVTTRTTEYDKKRDAENGYVPGDKHGTFTDLLLADGTYSVRYKAGKELVKIADVTISGETSKSVELIYDTRDAAAVSRFSSAVPLTVGQESAIASTGNNDILAKVTIPATPASSSAIAYEVDVNFNTTSESGYVYVYEETTDSSGTTYSLEDTFYYGSSDNIIKSAAADKTYVLSMTPYESDPKNQKIGNVNVKVSAYKQPYERDNATTALTLGTAATVVCARNVTDEDLKYVAYVKLSVEQGKKYALSYTSKTVGTEDIWVSDAFDNATPEISYDQRIISKDFTESEDHGYYGKYVFTAKSSGDAYIRLYTDDTIYTSIDVTASEVVSQ